MRLTDQIYNQVDSFLEKYMKLRKGERKMILLLQSNIFILISILLVLKPVFTSMMLSQYGVSIMPLAYVLIATTAVIIHAGVSRWSMRSNLISSIMVNKLIHIVILMAIGVCMIKDLLNPMVSVGLYVYISLFSLITITYFYQYCQSLLTIRDAKRIYAYIGTGAIAGGVFGGYFTSIVLPFVGNSGLVLISALLLCFSGLIMYAIHTEYKDDLDTHIAEPSPTRDEAGGITAIRNPHVRNLAMIIGLGVIVSKLVDYQFNYLVNVNITEEEELTSFFGFWYSTINIVGLLFQLFFVNKIIDRLSVQKSIMIMPVFIILSCVAMIIFPILAFGILVKLLDGSLKQSIYKTSTEINIMPLSPSLRSRAKSFIDVVVDSLATGAAGVLIYLVINRMDLPFVSVLWITISISALWLYYIYRSKVTYTAELANAISGDSLPLGESERIGSTSKKFYIDDYLRKVTSVNKDQKSALLDLMKHENRTVRKSAILRFANDYKSEVDTVLAPHINDPSIVVRKAVLFAKIMVTSNPKEVNAIFKKLSAANYVIATAALAEAIGKNSKQRKIYKLYERIDISISHLSLQDYGHSTQKYYGQLYKAIAIGKYIDKYYILKDAIQLSIDPSYQEQALKAIAYGKTSYLFDELKLEVISPENVKVFYQTISEFPNKLLELLVKLRKVHPPTFRKYLLACQYVDKQRHIDYLFTLLDAKSLKTKRVALKTLNSSRRKYPHLRFNDIRNYRRLSKEIYHLKRMAGIMTTIEEHAKDRADQVSVNMLNVLSRDTQQLINKSMLSVFIYLALITQREDINVIYNALKSQKKNEALDYLDGVLGYRLRKITVPVLEVIVHKDYTEEALKRIRVRKPKLIKALNYINKHGDVVTQRTISNLMIRLSVASAQVL